MANFSLSGKTPVCNIRLHIYVNGEIINGALNFNILLDISSYPKESLVFIDFIILLTSCVVAVLTRSDKKQKRFKKLNMVKKVTKWSS
jgi:hypothetical protein